MSENRAQKGARSEREVYNSGPYESSSKNPRPGTRQSEHGLSIDDYKSAANDSPAKIGRDTGDECLPCASTKDRVTTTLKRRDVVALVLEINAMGDAWCRIALLGQSEPLGYVLCFNLEQN
jgi:hypothetical protein